MPNLRFAAPKERRVALVTGGARGIGGASALRIAEEGRDIVIADIGDSGEIVRQIEAFGQRALFIKTDVTDEAAVQRTVVQAMEVFGRLDILVCCAGILGKEMPFMEQSAAGLRQGDANQRLRSVLRASGGNPAHAEAGLGALRHHHIGGTAWCDQPCALRRVKGRGVLVCQRAWQRLSAAGSVREWSRTGACPHRDGRPALFRRASGKSRHTDWTLLRRRRSC